VGRRVAGAGSVSERPGRRERERHAVGPCRVVEGGAERLGRPGLESVSFRLSAVLGAVVNTAPTRPWMGAGGGGPWWAGGRETLSLRCGELVPARAVARLPVAGLPVSPSRSWEHGGASRVRVSSCGGGGCRETGATRSRKRRLPPLCGSRGGRRYRADASLDGRGRRWTVVGGGS
jgi:hypothetical protein